MKNRVVKSIVRHGFPNTNRNRALTVFSNFFLHIHPVKVRKKAIEFKRTYYLGGLSAATFFILVATGILLMFYYHPSETQAYSDMKDLEFTVTAGVFLRNLHRWSAHLMVALVFLHMVRVFYAGAYKPPREFNWVLGVILFVLTILLSYTGYLLPWDQLAFWGVTVGTNMADAMPVIGDDISFLLLGSNQVDANTLVRFYVLHCTVLPAVMLLVIAVHVWRVRKDGGIYIPEDERNLTDLEPEEEG
jgi:quinol-cytochrome oxidoreductase complex cytochrome b subunit